MARFLMTVFGALVCGLAAWGAVGFAASLILSKGAGAHGGGGAMSGFFVVGGLGGIVGAVAGAWIVWRLLADPARMGAVTGGLMGLLLLLIVAVYVAMMPPSSYKDADVFPKGMRGEVQVEAKFPASEIAAIGPNDALAFQLRSSGVFLAVPWQRARIRHEGDRAIVPGAFPVEATGQWILAVMHGERQIDTTDVGPDHRVYTVNETTEWSAWSPSDSGSNSGLEYRWRFAVLPR